MEKTRTGRDKQWRQHRSCGCREEKRLELATVKVLRTWLKVSADGTGPNTDPRLTLGNSQTNQVGKDADGSWDTLRKLPKPGIGGENIKAFAICGNQQTAIQRRFSRVMTREQRLEAGIAFLNEIQPPLLHPAIKILPRNLVGKVKRPMSRIENGY